MKIAATLFVVLISASVFAAQAPSQRLTGRVLDPSGAVIAGANIKIFQGDIQIQETTADSVGLFSLSVPPGDYRLEVSVVDFNLYRQDVRVGPNTAPLTVRMALAAVRTNVDVAAERQQVSLEADAALTTNSLSKETIAALPDDEDQLLAQLQAIAGASGSTQSSSTLVVDGITGGRVPPRDQIQQIIVETSSFSAENTGGSRIQIITRPGTGPWSGSVNFGFNSEGMNAKNPLDVNKPERRQHIFQTSYGGPVIPGKLTFRLNAQTRKTENQSTSLLAVTPDGPVNSGVFVPNINRNLNGSGQLFLTQKNTINFNGNYNTNSTKNQGVGGFTLPERGVNFKGHNWNATLGDRHIFSPKLTSELRFYVYHNQNSALPILEAVSYNVIDAFNGGGAQNRTRRRNTYLTWGNTVRWTVTPNVNVTLGSDHAAGTAYSNSETNYIGVFTFSSLEDFIARRPVTFRQILGNPIVEVSQYEGSAFFQADWRVNTKLNVGAGVRYQAQRNLRDYNNVAPTFQVAYTPRKSTVLRAGGRFSHQVYDIFYTESVQRQAGVNNQVEIVITNPLFPDPFASGSGVAPNTNAGSIRLKDPAIQAPYTFNAAFTWEQELRKGWRFSTSFDINRAVHLIRTRNVNAPYPGTALSAELLRRLSSTDAAVRATARQEVDQMRPFYPFVGNMYQYESTGNAFSKNLNMRVFLPNLKWFKFGTSGFLQYTLGWTDDDGSAVNQYDWRSEWTRAATDTRHRMQGNINVTGPWATSFAFSLTANSGRPYSITTGRDENGDQATNDRPAGVSRNSVIGPGAYNVDLQAGKTIELRKPRQPRPANNAVPQIGGNQGTAGTGPRLNVFTQVINLFNNTQIRGYSGVVTSPLFGRAIGTAPGRIARIGLTMNW